MLKFRLPIAMILLSMLALPVHAAEETENHFSFRDIPWYTTKAEAEKTLVDSGAKIEMAVWPNFALRMSGIDYINVIGGDGRVEGGGCTGRYSGINVAGYDVTDTCAGYMFTLNEDGGLNKDEESAEFYFGWYTFDSNDFADAEGTYADLTEKLTSLYGDGIADDEDKYHSTVTWTDADGNQIRLLLGGKDGDNKYVTLGYMAADAEARLDEVQAALDAEAVANENAERELNKDNTSGL